MNFEKMFCTIDTHVVGEAFRIIIKSQISFVGTHVQSNQLMLDENFENEKNLLLNEPRGHRGMNGCIVVPSQEADYQLLFFNHAAANEFKYEALLAVTSALIETGNIKRSKDDSYKVETTNGIYTVQASVENQEVTSISLEGGACEITGTDWNAVSINVDNARNYLLYTMPSSIQGIKLEELAAVSNWGIAKTAELKKSKVQFDGVILVDQMQEDSSKVRSVTFEKDGYILRSPGIDSSCAILAFANTKSSKEQIVNESIFGATLTVSALGSNIGRFYVETTPYVTGSHEFIFDPEDPLKDGFILA